LGTCITVPGYCCLLNNELTDCNFTPACDATGNPVPTTFCFGAACGAQRDHWSTIA
jgi:hypothetical protein